MDNLLTNAQDILDILKDKYNTESNKNGDLYLTTKKENDNTFLISNGAITKQLHQPLVSYFNKTDFSAWGAFKTTFSDQYNLEKFLKENKSYYYFKSVKNGNVQLCFLSITDYDLKVKHIENEISQLLLNEKIIKKDVVKRFDMKDIVIALSLFNEDYLNLFIEKVKLEIQLTNF